MAHPFVPRRCGTCGKIYSGEERFCPLDASPLVLLEDDDPWVGKLVGGRFRVQERIGAGGMGAVYLAVQEPVERRVALKVLLPRHGADPVAKARFLREAKIVSRLSSPHTVTLYDFGEEEHGQLYLAMEYLEGQTLAARLRAQGALPLKNTLSIMGSVAESVSEAHAAGLVHRDLKPANVFLTVTHNERAFVKVLDFGLAASFVKVDDRVTQEGAVLGTPAYMAPERINTEGCDARADVYALGIMLYELLAGQRPFIGATAAEILDAHLHEEPPPIESARPGLRLGDDLEELIWRCLAKDPALRPKDATELGRLLRSAWQGAVGGGLGPAEEEPTTMLVARRPTIDDEEVQEAETPFEDTADYTGRTPKVDPDQPPTAETDLQEPASPPRRIGGPVWFAFAAAVALAATLILLGRPESEAPPRPDTPTPSAAVPLPSAPSPATPTPADVGTASSDEGAAPADPGSASADASQPEPDPGPAPTDAGSAPPAAAAPDPGAPAPAASPAPTRAEKPRARSRPAQRRKKPARAAPAPATKAAPSAPPKPAPAPETEAKPAGETQPVDPAVQDILKRYPRVK